MKIIQQIYSLASLQNKLFRPLCLALRPWSRLQARYQYIDLQQAKRSACQSRTYALTPQAKSIQIKQTAPAAPIQDLQPSGYEPYNLTSS